MLSTRCWAGTGINIEKSQLCKRHGKKQGNEIHYFPFEIYIFSSFYVCKALGSVWRHKKILDAQGIRYFH